MESSKNFKRLSDVEVVETPAETANVLIEENGIIKKAPKTAVGGSGGVKYDATIYLGTYSDTSNLSDLSGGEIAQGTVAMLEEKLANGEMPKVKGLITYSYYDSLHEGVFEFIAFGQYGENQIKGYCDVMTYSGHYGLEVYMRNDDIGDGNTGDRISSVTLQ